MGQAALSVAGTATPPPVAPAPSEPPALDAAWDWTTFLGSRSALKWNRRDLPTILEVLPYVRGRTAVIQAGGNLGIFPKGLAQHFATVYTFEPAPDLFAMLQHNAPESNIIKFQAAVGDTAKLIGMSRQRRDGKLDNHEGITHVAGDGILPQIPIDALHLPVVDLLWLDVEGYELFALWGAVETIRRCRPVLVVEINKSIKFVGHTGDEVRRVCTDLGYQSVRRMRSDEVFVPCPRSSTITQP